MSLILAIDLGQYKSVTCLDRSADDTLFTSFHSSLDRLARLIDTHRPAVVLIEACALSGRVHDLCVDLGQGLAAPVRRAEYELRPRPLTLESPADGTEEYFGRGSDPAVDHARKRDRPTRRNVFGPAALHRAEAAT